MVTPILEYGSELFHGKCDMLEKVQLKYLKIMLGVKQNTSNLAVYGETGHSPLMLRRKIKKLKYWAKILFWPNHSLVKITYNNLCTMSNCGYKTWIDDVTVLLNKVNMLYLWQTSNVTKGYNDICMFKKSIVNNYIKEWKEAINDNVTNPKLRTYKVSKLVDAIEQKLCCSY